METTTTFKGPNRVTYWLLSHCVQVVLLNINVLDIHTYVPDLPGQQALVFVSLWKE